MWKKKSVCLINANYLFWLLKKEQISDLETLKRLVLQWYLVTLYLRYTWYIDGWLKYCILFFTLGHPKESTFMVLPIPFSWAAMIGIELVWIPQVQCNFYAASSWKMVQYCWTCNPAHLDGQITSCYKVAKIRRKAIATTKNTCPTPRTRASWATICFVAAL